MRNRNTLPAVVTLAVVDFALFMTSGTPRYRDATDGMDAVVGNIAWFGFLVGALALVVIGSVAAIRRVRAAGARRSVDH